MINIAAREVVDLFAPNDEFPTIDDFERWYIHNSSILNALGVIDEMDDFMPLKSTQQKTEAWRLWRELQVFYVGLDIRKAMSYQSFFSFRNLSEDLSRILIDEPAFIPHLERVSDELQLEKLKEAYSRLRAECHSTETVHIQWGTVESIGEKVAAAKGVHCMLSDVETAYLSQLLELDLDAIAPNPTSVNETRVDLMTLALQIAKLNRYARAGAVDPEIRKAVYQLERMLP